MWESAWAIRHCKNASVNSLTDRPVCIQAQGELVSNIQGNEPRTQLLLLLLLLALEVAAQEPKKGLDSCTVSSSCLICFIGRLLKFTASPLERKFMDTGSYCQYPSASLPLCKSFPLTSIFHSGICFLTPSVRI